MSFSLIKEIDALLPQTQCGLCGYNGCMPYAKAMSENQAPINLCPPGGIETLHALSALLQQDPNPFIDDMKKKAKPSMTAVIREAECIGCTKCIAACPVDAIIGSAKNMHVILTDACTGCELCIPPCPVDCIDMQLINSRSKEDQQLFSDESRVRFERHQLRMQQEIIKENEKKPEMKDSQKKAALQSYVAAALDRIKKK